MSSLEDQRSFVRVSLHLWCTPEQLSRLESSIGHLLCPNSGHEGPCEIPWEINSFDESISEVPPDLLAEIRNFHPEQVLPE